MTRGFAIVCVCSLAFYACDDSAPQNTLQRPDGGGAGGSGGGTGGAGGGAGGAGGGGEILCAQDGQCPDGTFCALGDNGIGNCLPGCRDDDSCEGEQVCNTESRMCEDPPCQSDSDCPDEATYCNDGACVEGCRTPGEACAETDEAGRATICDEATRTCAALHPCCTGVDECVALLPAACEEMGGVVLNGTPTCDTNPCGVPCSDDDDCGDDLNRFCQTDDGRCGDGCRVDVPASCGEGQLCDPNGNQCIDLNCGADADCPDDRVCRLEGGQGLCVVGCRDDDACPEGQSCIDQECIEFCVPEDEDACDEGQYCNPATNRCDDLCTAHADCAEGQFCEADTGICRAGCRDDEGDNGEPNDDQLTATAIELTEPDELGRQFGSIAGRVLCDDNQDVFRVDVPAGARIRVDIQFDQGTPTFDLDGNSGQCGEDIDCATGLGWTCEERVCVGPTQEAEGRDQLAFMEYPALNELVQDETSYFITVNPNNRRVNYRVDVAVVDARTGCFPDRFEADGNNNRNESVRVEPGFAETISGTICDGDEDWFVLETDANDGLSLNLRSLTGEEVNVFLFAADENRGDAILLAGQDSDRWAQAVGSSYFVPAGDWHILVAGRTPDVSAEYQLDILHTPSVFECGDDDQGGSVDDAAQVMVGVDEEVDVGQALMVDLALCNADGPDVDVFCFEAGDGEVISAAIVMTDANAVAGRSRVQIVDEAGNVQGSDALNTIGDALDYAVYRGTMAGVYCARISGINRSQGDYTLRIRRSGNLGDMCGLYEAEVDGLRNDRASEATALPDLSMNGTHYAFDEGYICDPEEGRSDEDWYSFTINDANSALCLTLDGFDATQADVDVGVYPAVAPADGPDCTAMGQAHCDANGGGACIRGENNRSYCTPALERRAGSFDFEMVNIRRNIFRDRAGDYLIRVHHTDGNEGPYLLDVRVTPPADICEDDFYEPNDRAEDALFLGSGQVAMCDSWMCESDRDGDFFELEVPADEDRTILVNYSNLTEGRIFMDAVGPDAPGDMDSGRVESRIVAGNFQCINVAGGSADASISLELFAGAFAAANDIRRLDYSVTIVPTDLDADPSGACVRLGANDLGDCGSRQDRPEIPPFGRIQPENCWPTIFVP